jgi:hypothetical protein
MSTRMIGSAVVLALLLAGCGSSSNSSQSANDPSKLKHPWEVDPTDTAYDRYKPDTEEAQSGSLFGKLFGGGKSSSNSGSGGPPGVGVNSFLWRATLDTMSFMPLASADPFGGVIITDWYSPNESQNERFKLNVFILGRELRADGVRCTVFRQKRDPGGQWADAPVEQQTGIDIENAILSRARQMRLSTASK